VVAGQAYEREADELRVSALEIPATSRVVDHAERLMEPDRELRSEPLDQPSRETALGFRERVCPGIVKTARAPPGLPVPREVTVQVDASPVLSCSAGEAVRVQILEYPDSRALLRPRMLEPRGNGDPSALVTVDAADDEDAVLSARVPSGHNPNRSSQR